MQEVESFLRGRCLPVRKPVSRWDSQARPRRATRWVYNTVWCPTLFSRTRTPRLALHPPCRSSSSARHCDRAGTGVDPPIGQARPAPIADVLAASRSRAVDLGQPFTFHRDRGAGFLKSLHAAPAEVLVLAGDIAIGTDLLHAIPRFRAWWRHVVFVPGNHEDSQHEPDDVHAILGKCRRRRACTRSMRTRRSTHISCTT